MTARAAETPPAVIVIFGVTGDLSRRKLLPALYHLMKDRLLHDDTTILGVSRHAVTFEAVVDRQLLCSREQDGLCDPEAYGRLRQSTRFVQMDLADSTSYETLRSVLERLEEEKGLCLDRMFYLAVPPQATKSIVHHLGEQNLHKTCGHGQGAARLLLEKPFGYDLVSAKELLTATQDVFAEEQIFRIDHYIAKETVQNIVAFRMHNPVFAALWNKQYIASIRITAYEQIGIENRAIFYEQTGALRDFIQSHLLQLLAFVAMEPPAHFSDSDVHAAKLQFLESIRIPNGVEVASNAMRGQYDKYVHEVKNANSAVETYAALRVYSNAERWQNVPMILETGKGLPEKRTEVRIVFKSQDASPHENTLLFRLQPSEGMGLYLQIKQPGLGYQTQEVEMKFAYRHVFENHGHPDAYERVLLDAVKGDRMLFTTGHEVLAAWRVVDPVLAAWQDSSANTSLHTYRFGTLPVQL